MPGQARPQAPRRRRIRKRADGQPWVNPKRKDIKTGNPLIRDLFHIIDNRGLSWASVARNTFYSNALFRQWASGESGMRLTSFVDIANFLGYDVKLVPKMEKETEK